VQQGLVAEAGAESSRWLGDLLLQPSAALSPGAVLSPGGAAPLPLGAAVLGGEIGLKDLDSSFPTPSSPLPSVEEAFAALAAEFAPSPAEFAPSPAELEHITLAGLDQVDPSLLPPPAQTLSFAIAPAAVEPTAAVAPPTEEDPEPVRPWFGRVRGLLRTCFDEAIGSLNPVPLAPEPSPQEDTRLAAFADDPIAFAGDGVSFAPAQAGEPTATEPAAETEPLAPLPTFHPTASILAAMPEPPAATPAPTPARWLPRLGLVGGPSSRPAPAPADLADLRAWLPDSADDLPRAC